MTVTKILLLNSLYLREVNDNINNLKCEGVRGNGKEIQVVTEINSCLHSQ